MLQRSVFGGRKYSFRLLLESLVSLAGEFVSVRFVHIFEEWVGAKEQRLLDIRPLSLSGAAPAELERRAYLIRSLGGRHSYWAYRAGCFFPHKDRGPSTGGAGSADRRAAPGKLIVDTRRGLDLGHAPAAAVDDIHKWPKTQPFIAQGRRIGFDNVHTVVVVGYCPVGQACSRGLHPATRLNGSGNQSAVAPIELFAVPLQGFALTGR